MPPTAAELIRDLKLQPHPEGGYFREVYRSPLSVSRENAPRRYLTVIHFLLREGQHSRWHVVSSDEVWHFTAGERLELIIFDPQSGKLSKIELGNLEGGGAPLHVVPAGVWQAARSLGDYSLVNCTVGPGFEFEDFQFVSDLTGQQRLFTGPLAEYENLL